jgi:hypothetical protein
MKLPQPSLAGGELSPGLHGRTDIARFQVSVARMQNFIVRPTGGAIKRPGFLFDGKVKDKTKPPRALPFQYSTEIKYRIEAGEYYFRFWVKAGRGYVLLKDIDDVIIEIVTPYAMEHLPFLKITQSADVLYIGGVNKSVRVAPMELRRITPLQFELIPHSARRGPFRSMNSDEATRMAVTSTTGNTVVTCNREVFTDKMVKGLIYFEEKELRSVKPWTPLERNITLGAQRRSDGKVYRAVSVPNLGSLPGAPYSVCGNDRPVHEVGRAFDGPQDVRNDGVNGYVVGIEWEYLHGAFGIVQITEYVSAFSVKGVVVERLADSIVGTAPAPVHAPWVFSGDNVDMTFSVAGATSTNPLDYIVTINGSAVQSNPYTPPISGGSGPGGGNNTGPIFGDGSLIQQF